MFGREVFWRDIPSVVGYGENMFRVTLLAVPLFIPLRRRPVGLAMYAAGLTVYVASWVALIGWPHSAWSTSAAGLLAPAFTPVVWAVGIGLIGRPRLGRFVFPAWLYPACAAMFTIFHVTHAAMVYSRLVP